MRKTHLARMAPSRYVGPDAIYTESKADGVLCRKGIDDAGQDIVLGYEFHPEKHTPGTALAWLDSEGVEFESFYPARMAKSLDFGGDQLAERKSVQMWVEALRPGTWNAKTGRITIKPENVREFVSNTKAVLTAKLHRPLSKLTHSQDQSMARELFEKGPEPMGPIIDVELRDGNAWVLCDLPIKVAKAIKLDLLGERSCEIYRDFGGKKWVLHALAWLGNTPPAVKNLAKVSVELEDGERLPYEEGADLVFVFAERDGGTDPAQGSGQSTSDEKIETGTAAGPVLLEGQDPNTGEETMNEEQIKELEAAARKLIEQKFDGLALSGGITPAEAQRYKSYSATLTVKDAMAFSETIQAKEPEKKTETKPTAPVALAGKVEENPETPAERKPGDPLVQLSDIQRATVEVVLQNHELMELSSTPGVDIPSEGQPFILNLAEAQSIALADQAVEKSGGKLTFAEAWGDVMRRRPDLRKAYHQAHGLSPAIRR